ncbi:hypothetical protein AYO45_04635 [Gammaproteobacteria bacterium SCGC AG-212-F23]|nr:hypothetical protein AYO45_04635 [Gammaproteobacteria bacterium SCGC AG-212-F23]
MPIQLAERTKVPGSAIRQIFKTLTTINAERKKDNLQPIRNLSIGQPHIKLNQVVVDRLVNDLKEDRISFDYPPTVGTSTTLEMIVKLYNHWYPSVSFTTDEVMVTVGATEALMNAFNILLNPGDVILAFKPYFSTYKVQVASIGATLTGIPMMRASTQPDILALEKELQTNSKVKAVILNYPNNPSGYSLTKSDVLALAKVFEKFPDVAIIIDDVYRDLNYSDHFTALDVAPQLKNRCIIINSSAKGLAGAPGLRVGLVSANSTWMQAMAQQEICGTAGVCVLSQRALEIAIHDYLEDKERKFLTKIRQEYENNLNIMQAELAKYNLKPLEKPGGAFYLLVNAKHLVGSEIPAALGFSEKIGTSIIRDDVDIVNYFMHAANVGVVPGSGFDLDPKEGFFRISCAQPADKLIASAKAMGEATRLLIQPVVVKKPVTTSFNWIKAALYTSFGVASAYAIYGLFTRNNISTQVVSNLGRVSSRSTPH